MVSRSNPDTTLLLLQGCHSSYWLGYRATTWGIANYRPLDSLVPFNKSSYTHWGGGEPDGRRVPELCVVANQTQAFGGAYGWSDTRCEQQKMVSMCRIMREWHSGRC